MVVGVCVVELYLPGCRSLKEKRQALTSLIERLRARFNVAVAEIDSQDLWQRAELGICTVANSDRFVDEVLAKAARWVEGDHRVVVERITMEKR